MKGLALLLTHAVAAFVGAWFALEFVDRLLGGRGIRVERKR